MNVVVQKAEVCPIVAAVLNTYGDLIHDDTERERRLRPWRQRVGRSGSTVEVEVEVRRTWQAFDWLYRRYAPLLIRAVDDAGLGSFATAMENLPPVTGLVTYNVARCALHLAYPALTRSSAIFDTAERRALFSLVLIHGSTRSVRDERSALSMFSTCLSGPYSFVQGGTDRNVQALFDSFDGLLDRMVDP